MEDQKDKPSLSILDKFRQLSKQKEEELSEARKNRPIEKVDAVYLKNNCGSSRSNNSGRKHWNHRAEKGDNFHGKRKHDSDSSHDWKTKRYLERQRSGQHVGLKAENVYITEYVSSLPGFNGIIKQRFSDFQVNELSEDGTVVKLTSQVLPEEPLQEHCTLNVLLENDDDLLKILPRENWDKLYQIIENENVSDSVEVDVTEWTKDQRIQVHGAIKNLFQSKASSNTRECDGRKILKIRYSVDGGNRARRSFIWRNRKYLHFVLHKENIDTTEAVNLLSRKLNKKTSTLTYCGTKDKRAKTTQRVSIQRVSAERLHRIQPLRSIALGNYEYKDEPLKLGQLNGNRFRIAIRNIDATDEILKELIDSLKTKGFLNYFGMQRFGASVIVPTHLIGKVLIGKNWKEAVELLLKPRPGERCYPEIAEARKIWTETKDAKKALKCFHWKHQCLEANLLRGLDKSGPNAYLNALENITRNLLSFYGHAYQSYIWNRIISRRVKEFGFTPIPGDIVLIKDVNDDKNDNCDKDINSDNSNKNCEDDDDDEDEEEVDNSETNIDDSECNLLLDEYAIETSRYSFKFLSEEEAKETNLEEVVYPLPGYDIDYPKNIIADWYHEFLKEDDLSQDHLSQMKKYSHLFPLYGTYRKIIEKPGDVTWSCVNYSDENSDLIISDYDELNGVKPSEDCPDGKYKALLIEFNLSPCTYATMALREIMKCETSSSHQAKLTAKHQSETEKNNEDNNEDEEKTPPEKIIKLEDSANTLEDSIETSSDVDIKEEMVA